MMFPRRVGIIDIGMGNLHSVTSAMEQIGVQAESVRTAESVGGCTHLILPGVGSFREASTRLELTGIGEAVRAAVQEGTFLLGICLGMQLLGSSSTEDGPSRGLGLLHFDVDKFNPTEVGGAPIPHVGFSQVKAPENGLFRGIPERSSFYFVHSFRSRQVAGKTWYASAEYGSSFLAAVGADGVMGTQFHPEKSQGQGLRLLRNFAMMAQ
jgi:glutamine amidotransferase